MKKTRILGFAAGLLALSMLVVGCKKNEEPIEEDTGTDAVVETPAPKLLETVFTNEIGALMTQTNFVKSFTQIKDSAGTALKYDMTNTKMVGNMLVKLDNSGSYNVYTIYNLTKGEVVATLTNSEDVTYSIDETYGLAYVLDDTKNGIMEYHLFDPVTATEIAVDKSYYSGKTYVEQSVSGFYGNGKLMEIGKTAVIKWSGDSGLTKLSDIPEYKAIPDFSNYEVEITDKYIYAISKYISYKTTIYDKSFNYVVEVKHPQMYDDFYYVVLNDGKLLVQYTMNVPADSEEYDFSRYLYKCDVLSMIIDPATAETTTVELDYVLASSFAYTNSMFKSICGVDLFCAPYENAVQIYNIVDKNISSTEECWAISNSGEKQLNISDVLDGSKSLPTPAGNGYYMASRDGDVVIIDAEGKVISSFSDNFLSVSMDHFISYNGKYGIYDLLTMQKIYDFEDKNIISYKKHQNVVVFTEKTVKDEGLATQTDVYTTYRIDAATKKVTVMYVKTGTEYKLGDGTAVTSVTSTAFGYCVEKDGKYTYYNFIGEAIGTFDTILSSQHSVVIDMIMETTVYYMTDGEGNLYLFK